MNLELRDPFGTTLCSAEIPDVLPYTIGQRYPLNTVPGAPPYYVEVTDNG